jgi:hypothetical protein
MTLRNLINPFWKRVLIWAAIGGISIFVDNAAFASTRSPIAGVAVGAGLGAIFYLISYSFEKRRRVDKPLG